MSEILQQIEWSVVAGGLVGHGPDFVVGPVRIERTVSGVDFHQWGWAEILRAVRLIESQISKELLTQEYCQ